MGGGGRGRGGGRGGGGRGGINVVTPSAKRNCQTTSKTARFTLDYQPLIVLFKKKYFVFILSLRFVLELKHISIAYIRDVCHHINCCEFYHFNASVNWNQTQALIRSEPNKR